MKTEVKLTRAELTQFTGTENWYRHALVRTVLYTDGVQYLAERAGAHWLIDEIALAQRYQPEVAAEEFQLWRLTVHDDRRAILACENGNGDVVLTKEIPFTDFPFDEIKLYSVSNTIMLPSEY
jgi:hypothetical protein